jgi:hypothetical protein
MSKPGNSTGGGDGEWRVDDIKSKKDLAVDFINAIRTMEPAALNGLIVREAGEDLAQFFLSDSANLISKDPSRVLENTSSLMLMGYLIRVNEERRARKSQPMFQQAAADA